MPGRQLNTMKQFTSHETWIWNRRPMLGTRGRLPQQMFETMGGTRYLYTPSGFTAQIEGEGMVFTMPGTVFYGYFKDETEKCLLFSLSM